MSEQAWHCETCAAAGSVPLKEHEDFWSVYQKIKTDHIEKSPACETGTDFIRIGKRTPPIESPLGHRHVEPATKWRTRL